MDGPDARRKSRLGLALKIAVAVAIVGAAFLLPLHRWALTLVEWVRAQGAVGAVIYGTTYAIGGLVVPGSLLTLGAGFAYGPILGVAVVSPASVATASLAFILGRWFARDWVARKVEGRPMFAAIDRAVAKNGFKIVLLLRLSPVFPFIALNYGLGTTRVRFDHYVLASFLGMLPATFLFVYLGSVLTSAAALVSGERPDAGPWGQVLFWGGLVATVVVTMLIARMARRELNKELVVDADEASSHDAEPEEALA